MSQDCVFLLRPILYCPTGHKQIITLSSTDITNGDMFITPYGLCLAGGVVFSPCRFLPLPAVMLNIFDSKRTKDST